MKIAIASKDLRLIHPTEFGAGRVCHVESCELQMCPANSCKRGLDSGVQTEFTQIDKTLLTEAPTDVE